MFPLKSKLNLAKAALFKNTPVYVQFYITARCNLTCEQCNIIYANSDLRECSLDEINKIADNFAELGVAIVLLTGGEPFARKDLPSIIKIFSSRGIHVRMQTNGFAKEDEIIKCIEAGGTDISISLDSLDPSNQDKINGDFNRSWNQALKAISLFTKHLPKDKSFASLGCVLQPSNFTNIIDVIEFGTQISWFTSLVPVHVTDYKSPLGFRTFDNKLRFTPSQFDEVDRIIEAVRAMRNDGYLLYDSDQYLDDIKKFIRADEVTWRKKNDGICDSPNLYFAVLPNGDFAPCCDYRINQNIPTYANEFQSIFFSNEFRNEVKCITSKCDGCMYGSYPEISISMRFHKARIERAKTFIFNPPHKNNWPLSYEDLIDIAHNIRIKNAQKN